MFDRSAHEVFVEKAYRETLGLLEEVRDYVADPDGGEGEGMLPQDRAVLLHEMTKITRRLADAMAWLMVQKAVAANEIAPEEAVEQDAGTLPPEPEAVPGEDIDLGSLPLAARGLIDRSRRIYAEVERLQTSIQRAAD